MSDISLRPAHLTTLRVDDAFGTLDSGRPPRITPDDGFTVYDAQGEEVMPRSIDLRVVMLRENPVRQFYAKDNPYNPDEPAPPVCYSDNRVTPSQGASQPQSELCANCPRAVRDVPSRNNPTVMKSACENRVKVACLVVGGGPTVYLLSIPPMSLTPYEQYKRYLKSHDVGPYQVITHLTYEKKILGFQFSDWLAEKQVAYVGKVLKETDEAQAIIGALDKPRQTALPAPHHAPLPPSPPIVASPDLPFAPSKTPMVMELQVEPPKEKRHRRTKAEMEALRVAQAPSVPPRAELSGPDRVAPVVNITSAEGSVKSISIVSAGEGFGMEKPETIDAEMQRRMDEAFRRVR